MIESNNPLPMQPKRSLAHIFMDIVRTSPDAPALYSNRGTLRYGTLFARASRLAIELRRRGVTTEVPVGIAIERCEMAFVAVLAVLLAGGCYVPIDPGYPIERQRFIADDCGAPVILLASKASLEWLPASRRIDLDDIDDVDIPAGAPGDDRPLPNFQDDSLLYILYTSGSTGRPKGVCGTHSATLRRLEWGWEHTPFVSGEVVAHRTSLNFVDGVPEMFSGLLRGVPTAIVSVEDMMDLGRFLATLRQYAVTRLTVVPSLLAAMLRTVPVLADMLPHLRVLTSSGEALSADLLRRFRAAHPGATLLNLYGSTEITGDVSCAEFLPDSPLTETNVPIGYAIASTELILLDDHAREVIDGEPGELYVGGPLLSRGYHRLPAEEAKRFMPHPSQPGSRLFRTGDRMRRRNDGQLEYLGRLDHQVKIRGIRVDIDEIESVMARALPPGGRVAVVAVPRETAPETRYLCAFVAPDSVNWMAVRRRIALLLPPAFVPEQFYVMESLPLTPNGKIDRLTLVAQASIPRAPQNFIPPDNDIEQRIAALWTRILGVAPIGRNDIFVKLGGDSLALAEVLATLPREFGVNVPPKLARDGTLADVASWIVAKPADSPLSSPARYEILAASEVDPYLLAGVMAEVFSTPNEPIATITSTTAAEFFTTIAVPLVAACVNAGLSFVTRDLTTGAIVGFCMAHDFRVPPLISAPSTAPRSLRPVLGLLTQLGGVYEVLRGEAPKGEVVEIFATGAIPGHDGFDLASRLEERTLAAAAALGFRRAVTICTHRVTTQISESAGFVRLAAQSYATFEYEGRPILESLAQVHGEAVLFEKEISVESLD